MVMFKSYVNLPESIIYHFHCWCDMLGCPWVVGILGHLMNAECTLGIRKMHGILFDDRARATKTDSYHVAQHRHLKLVYREFEGKFTAIISYTPTIPIYSKESSPQIQCVSVPLPLRSFSLLFFIFSAFWWQRLLNITYIIIALAVLCRLLCC